ncbi:MAG: Dabb family protein [Amaricoccus sp.]|uniref:Dabb family protein n=1 Tax=Amaricoccus sp. TaxID=1872485 RepID=UPI0039E30259
MLRHIVTLRFREGTSPETRNAIYRDLAGLSDVIEGILDFRHFANVSVEVPLVRGFRDVFWFDFRDEAVRDAYLVDPTHRAIGERIVAELEGGADGVLVMDVIL